MIKRNLSDSSSETSDTESFCSFVTARECPTNSSSVTPIGSFKSLDSKEFLKPEHLNQFSKVKGESFKKVRKNISEESLERAKLSKNTSGLSKSLSENTIGASKPLRENTSSFSKLQQLPKDIKKQIINVFVMSTGSSPSAKEQDLSKKDESEKKKKRLKISFKRKKPKTQNVSAGNSQPDSARTSPNVTMDSPSVKMERDTLLLAEADIDTAKEGIQITTFEKYAIDDSKQRRDEAISSETQLGSTDVLEGNVKNQNEDAKSVPASVSVSQTTPDSPQEKYYSCVDEKDKQTDTTATLTTKSVSDLKPDMSQSTDGKSINPYSEISDSSPIFTYISKLNISPSKANTSLEESNKGEVKYQSEVQIGEVSVKDKWKKEAHPQGFSFKFLKPGSKSKKETAAKKPIVKSIAQEIEDAEKSMKIASEHPPTLKDGKKSAKRESAGNSEKREHLYKILVIGELGAGKTSIIKRYVHQFFCQHYRATIGVDFALKVLNWDQQTVIRLQLWDIAGQERFGNMTRVYYKQAVGAFIVFDVTNSKTFEAVTKWKTDLDAKVTLPDGSCIPAVLLANKCDQPKEGIVSNPSRMDDFCRESSFAGWFETSAKENINIDEATKFLISKILYNEKEGLMVDESIDKEKFSIDSQNDNGDEDDKNKCLC